MNSFYLGGCIGVCATDHHDATVLVTALQHAPEAECNCHETRDTGVKDAHTTSNDENTYVSENGVMYEHDHDYINTV